MRRNETWYVRMRVPQGLVPTLGKTHLVRSLETREAIEARARRGIALAQLRTWLASLDAEKSSWRLRLPGEDPDNHEATHRGENEGDTDQSQVERVVRRVEDAAELAAAQPGQCVAPQIITGSRGKSASGEHCGNSNEVGEPQAPPQPSWAVRSTTSGAGEDRRRTVLVGQPTTDRSRRTPAGRPHTSLPPTSIEVLAGKWLGEASGAVTGQTIAQHRVAIAELTKFVGEGTPVANVARRVAGAFVSDVLKVSGRAQKTINRLISSLSSLWRWLERRGFVDDNPWRGQGDSPRRRGERKAKRAYTQSELVSLLQARGPDVVGDRYGPAIDDLMRLGLVTGARLNELAELRAIDIDEATRVIRIAEGKTESATRAIPVHPLVWPIVKRRIAAATDGNLFGELARGGPDNKRSWYVSKIFTRYRRRVLGSDDRVDFHSFRRCFATYLERAATLSPAVTASVIAELMGHVKPTLALSLYSDGLDLGAKATAIDLLPRVVPADVQTAIRVGER